MDVNFSFNAYSIAFHSARARVAASITLYADTTVVGYLYFRRQLASDLPPDEISSTNEYIVKNLPFDCLESLVNILYKEIHTLKRKMRLVASIDNSGTIVTVVATSSGSAADIDFPNEILQELILE